MCYNPHPTDCDKFVQCYFAGTGQEKAAYRQCPFGLYWDHSILNCRVSTEVDCPNGMWTKAQYVSKKWTG